VAVALGEAIPRAGPWLVRTLLAIAALEGPATLGLTFLASVVIENLKAVLDEVVIPWRRRRIAA
jgi:hypothetical protein